MMKLDTQTQRSCMISAVVLVILFLLFGCASLKKPCSEAGDTNWYIPGQNQPLKFGGDKKCAQKKQRDGSWINEGKYKEFYKNGTLALEGDFAIGIKNGVWVQYSPDGKKVLERTYENGVEKKQVPIQKTKGITY